MKVDLLIKGKYILTMDDNLRVIENGAVAVEENKIIAIDTFESIKTGINAKDLIDIGDGIVMPGMINTHTHAAMSYFRGLADDLPLDKWLANYIWPAEKKYINPEFIKKSSELACLEMIKSGTTCFNDMYFFEEVTANVVIKCGLRAVLGEGILNFPTPSCQTPEEGLKKTESLIEKFKKEELINIAAAPHSIYTCDEELLKKAKRLADNNNLILSIHVSETKDELEKTRDKYGITPVGYLEKIGFLGNNVVAAHSVWLDEEDLKIYKKRGVKISHNPISNMKLTSGVAPILKVFHELKMDVGLGTDGAASNNTQDLFTDMRVAALIHKISNEDPVALTAEDIIKIATAGGAKCLNLDNKIGTLETGKRADIITVDLEKPHLQPVYNPYSHLVYCANASDVNDVIVNGKIIMRDRAVLTLNEKQILKEAREFKIKK